MWAQWEGFVCFFTFEGPRHQRSTPGTLSLASTSYRRALFFSVFGRGFGDFFVVLFKVRLGSWLLGSEFT